MTDNQHDPTWINASPTKEFFIYMLVRDVPLTRAILDLVDNCVDGARRTRPNNNFEGLTVRLTVLPTHFQIVDNCGGIAVDIARSYAFRFGRPKSAAMTSHSIGQFGVGMKRSIFKLGGNFTVESTTKDSRFCVASDIERWMSESGNEEGTDWHFQFSQLEEGLDNVDSDQIGTRVEITNLHPPIVDSFNDTAFLARLADEISVAHSMNMDHGLRIFLNDIALTHEPQRLLQSDVLHPAFVEKIYERQVIDEQAGSPVRVRLYAGVSDREFKDGGWYIFCNGRLVLRADKDPNTVWGRRHNMPQYHPNFAYFRGYAYFDSEDASLLPWTTTKTGVDADSRIYKLAQQEMVEATKPILQFLSQLDKERVSYEAGDLSDRRLANAIQSALSVRVLAIEEPGEWLAPEPVTLPPGLKMQKIQFSKPADVVERAKRILQVNSFTAIGEETFDYFMRYEGEE